MANDPYYALRLEQYNAVIAQYNERSRIALVDASLREFGVQSLTTLIAQDLLIQAASQAAAGAQEALRSIASAFDKAITDSRRGRLQELYTKAAEEALRSIDNAYMRRARRTRASSQGIGYRPEARFTGGALRRALTSPQMYRASSDGVSFINPVWLDTQARQWYRLNFGAGQRGASSPAGRQYSIKIFGETLPGDIGLAGYGPSAGFTMPSGFWSSSYPGTSPVQWSNGRTGHDFFILGAAVGPIPGQRGGKRFTNNVYRRTPTATLGIQGSHFLDVGVGRLAQTFPIAIETVVGEWLKAANAGVSSPFTSPNVNINSRILGQATALSSSIRAARESNIRTARFTKGL